MYEGRTEDVIRQEMLDDVTSNISKNEGTLIYDALSPVANQLTKTYIDLDSILKKAFAQDAYDIWLDKRCAEFGVIRKPGVKATGTVKFTGATGTVIPTGFLVTTADQLDFKTTEDVTIAAGVATAPIEAYATGPQYNVPIGTINQISSAQAGVNNVINEVATTGGADIESDVALKARLLLKVQTPATSGNVYHYKQWALEVPGVGAAKVFPVWNGPGTVKVCIVDTNKQPANQSIIDDALAHIEEERPVGATVTVTSATPLAVNLVMTVKRDNSVTMEDLETALILKLTNYLKTLAFESTYISISKIITLIVEETGVVDLISITMNGSNANVAIGDEEIAGIGTVIINEQL